MLAEKKWILNSQGDIEKTVLLSKELGIQTVLANLLVQRGIDTVEKANKFFNPKLEELYSPFLMKDMDCAVKRLEQAIANNENIMVYGDYDVDGTTAVSLMYVFINYIIGHKKVQFYIPDRYKEGYGISKKSIEYAKSREVKLIIALDCGIKANEEISYAKSIGIDFIICDHHLPGDVLPDTVAVLDPKRSDCQYPFKELSGCGVGFKFAQAYSERNDIPFEKIESLLDFLVVSIASDIVSIIDENRILAYFGLKRLSQTPCLGLKSIINICELNNQNITIDDIVFKIGPRINAAGRMENEIEGGSSSGGNNSVKLLISNSKENASEYGRIINDRNDNRKEIDRTITDEARVLVESDINYKTRKCTVIYNPSWMKGVVGIVASRLIESYYRPTVVLTESNGLISGSARSIVGFDLYQAIEHCSDLLENFGGHTYAAGLTMKSENLEPFKTKFEAYVNANITDDILIPHLNIDCYLDLKEIDSKLMREISKFQPFGPGNNRPVFCTKNVHDSGQGRPVGKTGEHLKLDIINKDIIRSIPAIAFGQSNKGDYALSGNPFDICYSITENNYRGETKLQLRVKDIKM